MHVLVLSFASLCCKFTGFETMVEDARKLKYKIHGRKELCF